MIKARACLFLYPCISTYYSTTRRRDLQAVTCHHTDPHGQHQRMADTPCSRRHGYQQWIWCWSFFPGQCGSSTCSARKPKATLVSCPIAQPRQMHAAHQHRHENMLAHASSFMHEREPQRHLQGSSPHIIHPRHHFTTLSQITPAIPECSRRPCR